MVAGPEDTPDTLSFYSEPVMASLSNIITPPDDKEKDKGTSLSKDYTFLEVELKYGILQVSDPYESCGGVLKGPMMAFCVIRVVR